MITVFNRRGIQSLTNQYDSNDRMSQQTLADSNAYTIGYTTLLGKATQASVTNPRGFQRQVSFNGSGYVVSDIEAVGKPSQERYSYSFEARTKLLLSATTPLPRT